MLVPVLFALSWAQTSLVEFAPFTPGLWVPDQETANWIVDYPGLEMNGDYIRAPKPDQNRNEWLKQALRWRDDTIRRDHPTVVRFDYDGERAYVRMRDWVGRELHLAPGETISYRFEAKGISGHAEVGFAFDYTDPGNGRWTGWSEIVANVDLPSDGQWHAQEVNVTVPQGPKGSYVLPIFGQDGVHTKQKGVWDVRNLTLTVKSNEKRQALAKQPRQLNLSIYDRKDLQWNTHNLTCGFLFVYDSKYFNRAKQTYDVEAFDTDMRKQFGGVDSVQLWQAYPRIGFDPRNQFDFYRDMPGGLAGVRSIVRRFHKLGVKVWFPYNPWDGGTRREPMTDSEALAKLLHDTEADGLFLDTMNASPKMLRLEVDKQRKGAIFEPEVNPSIDELQVCSGSWAQWQADYPEPGLIVPKWIEPRHMRHAIRRTDAHHFAEIEAAFFNGSGMMVWENVFGSWNPWSPSDSLEWSRASRVLRTFADTVCATRPNPFVPCLRSGLYANQWQTPKMTIWLMANRGDRGVSGPLLKTDQPGQAIDLISGVVLNKTKDGTISGKIGRLAAILVSSEPAVLKKAKTIASENASLLIPQLEHREGIQPAPPLPVIAKSLQGMVPIKGATYTMHVEHERRECGCYADPGVSPSVARTYTFGIQEPFGKVIHNITFKLAPYWIDEALVTNGEYEAFLKATGYQPKVKQNFLKHWNGVSCPEALRDHPVVYVDLDDARAYARWAGKRLPTESEWTYAGQGTDGRTWPWGSAFDSSKCNASSNGTSPVRQFPSGRSPSGCYDMTGNVWQWTDSEADDGHTRWSILRGGSWFKAQGSGWYAPGGAQPLTSHAKFLLLSPGLDRCSTIGFRCVADNPVK